MDMEYLGFIIEGKEYDVNVLIVVLLCVGVKTDKHFFPTCSLSLSTLNF